MIHEKNIYYLLLNEKTLADHNSIYLVFYVLLMNRWEFYVSGHKHYKIIYNISLLDQVVFFVGFWDIT